jgi:hypothetical protein
MVDRFFFLIRRFFGFQYLFVFLQAWLVCLAPRLGIFDVVVSAQLLKNDLGDNHTTKRTLLSAGTMYQGACLRSRFAGRLLRSNLNVGTPQALGRAHHLGSNFQLCLPLSIRLQQTFAAALLWTCANRTSSQ